jgi:protein-tyrosine phosphatase
MSGKVGQGVQSAEQRAKDAAKNTEQKVVKKADQVKDGADQVKDNAGKTNDTGVKAVIDKLVINPAAGVIGITELLGAKYGVSNPYQLKVDDTVTRGSEPDLSKVKQQGIKRVVNWQKENDDRHKASALSLNELYLPVLDNTPPTPRQLKRFLDFVVDAARHGQKVFVHCLTGRGRTGVAIAAYRMALYGWNPQQALDEAIKVGGTTAGITNPLPNERKAILDFGALLGWVQKGDGSWERSNPSKVKGYPRELPHPS